MTVPGNKRLIQLAFLFFFCGTPTLARSEKGPADDVCITPQGADRVYQWLDGLRADPIISSLGPFSLQAEPRQLTIRFLPAGAGPAPVELQMLALPAACADAGSRPGEFCSGRFKAALRGLPAPDLDAAVNVLRRHPLPDFSQNCRQSYGMIPHDAPQRWRGGALALLLSSVLLSLFKLRRRRGAEAVWLDWKPPGNDSRSRNTNQLIVEITIVIAIVLIGLVLRLSPLLNRTFSSLQDDEARIGTCTDLILKTHIPILNCASAHEPPLSLYYSLPFVFFLGKTPLALGLASFISGLLALIFSYLAAREFFNKHVAFLVLIFCATSPFLVTFSSVLYEHSFMPMYTAVFLFCFIKYLRLAKSKPQNGYLHGAILCAGLGASTKVIFFYFLAAVAAAGVLSGLFREIRWKELHPGKVLAAFVLGFSPLLTYMCFSNRLVEYSIGTVFRTNLDNNLKIFANIARLNDAFSASYYPFFAVAVIAGLIASFSRQDRNLLFLCLLSIGLWLLNLITPTGIIFVHLLAFGFVPYALLSYLALLALSQIKILTPVPQIAFSIALLAFLSARRNFAMLGELTPPEVIAQLRKMPPHSTIALVHGVSYHQVFMSDELPSLSSTDLVSLVSPLQRSAHSKQSILSEDIDARYLDYLSGQQGTRNIDERLIFDMQDSPAVKASLLGIFTQLVKEGKIYFIFNAGEGSPYMKFMRIAKEVLITNFPCEQVLSYHQVFFGQEKEYYILKINNAYGKKKA